MSLRQAYQQFEVADAAWDAILVNRFGADAGQARYELRGRGVSVKDGLSYHDDELAAAFEERSRVFAHWDQMRFLSPAGAHLNSRESQ